jgi:hypothetical protein
LQLDGLSCGLPAWRQLWLHTCASCHPTLLSPSAAAAAACPQITCAPSSAAQQEPLDLEAIEAQLRGVLLKLQYADSYLRRLPPGCTFEVVAYTVGRGSSGAGGVPQQAWAEEQPRPGHLELQQVGGWSGGALPACLLLGGLPSRNSAPDVCCRCRCRCHLAA